ncbi:SH3 domain-containing protein [Dyella jejuensis]|uniref:SH3 domain-containing protein n=1 Tax=Dyella jejuensis TaxID=1432009 RepID=A0ABW8JIB9_9GAMM
MKCMPWSLVAALMMIVPAAAFAADGYLVADVNMRAGPDTEYPALLVLPSGTPVSVQGCTAGWEWCDVITGPNRGWVAGTYIEYEYNNQPVYVADYGAQIGIPIVSFAIASYWGRYYTNRPFYRDRARWYGRPIPIRPPARPPHPIRPPGGHRPQPPGGGHRPPPGGNRPQPPGGNRPRPPGGNRPQPPGNGHRPPPGGNRPQPPAGNRPQPPGTGNRPQPPAGNRPPPPGGGNRPQPGQGNRPAERARPAPRPEPKQGNNGNNGG